MVYYTAKNLLDQRMIQKLFLHGNDWDSLNQSPKLIERYTRSWIKSAEANKQPLPFVLDASSRKHHLETTNKREHPSSILCIPPIHLLLL